MARFQDTQEALSTHLFYKLQFKRIFQKFVFSKTFFDNSRHADGSHLSIKFPNDGAQTMKEDLNFRGFYLIILMSLVDTEYWFIWASVGAQVNTWFYSVAIDWSLENNRWKRGDSQCSSTVGRYWNTTLYFGWRTLLAVNIYVKTPCRRYTTRL